MSISKRLSTCIMEHYTMGYLNYVKKKIMSTYHNWKGSNHPFMDFLLLNFIVSSLTYPSFQSQVYPHIILDLYFHFLLYSGYPRTSAICVSDQWTCLRCRWLHFQLVAMMFSAKTHWGWALLILKRASCYACIIPCCSVSMPRCIYREITAFLE